MTDAELIKVAQGFRDGILAGRSSDLMCYVVSAPLQGFLSVAYRLETTLEEADFGDMNHMWLRLPDGRILDATADQFPGMPPVYLGDVPQSYRAMMVVKCDTDPCPKGGAHEWGTDGQHSNEYCKKCFVPRR